jgi:hypothetical protein
MQVTTGKTQRLKFKSHLDSRHEEGQTRLQQTGPLHLVAAADQGMNMRVLSIEFENLKEAIAVQ